MFKKLPIIIFLLVALVTAIAASSRQDAPQGPQAPPEIEPAVSGEQLQQLTEEFHQTYPLSATGRVTLENINGGVKIKVWDRAAVQVDAVKKAYRQERLAEAKIEVRATDENIRIKTEYSRDNQSFNSGDRRYNNTAIVEYTLTVPRQAVMESIELVNGSLEMDGVEGNVNASSINGKVIARGLSGAVKLSTVNGQLHATFTQLNASKSIFLNSVNGNVTLVIPSDSHASLRASTVHGSISNDFGINVKHGEYVGHSLNAQVGTGGPRIKLNNVNGSIRISRAQDGRNLSPVTSIASNDDTDEISVEVAQATSDNQRIRIENERVARQVQRQVDAAMRQAQREIERAQRQLLNQQAREQVKAKAQAKALSVNRGRAVRNGDSGRFTTQEERSFSVSGAPRVNLTTFDGQITVRGWDKPEVSYTATKRANDENVLKQISILSEQQGQTVSIIAQHDHEPNGSVQLEVYVPRRASLHVSTGDGRLNLQGVTGDITLRSGDGPIEVSESGGQLHVNTGDGPIRISKFDGQVDARTGDGAIVLDGNFNALSARTGEGSISLSVPAGSSFTIETNSPEAISSEGFTMVEDITPSPRMKRWRIGNGGKVFVLRTGEGKILLRPR